MVGIRKLTRRLEKSLLHKLQYLILNDWYVGPTGLKINPDTTGFNLTDLVLYYYVIKVKPYINILFVALKQVTTLALFLKCFFLMQGPYHSEGLFNRKIIYKRFLQYPWSKIADCSRLENRSILIGRHLGKGFMTFSKRHHFSFE